MMVVLMAAVVIFLVKVIVDLLLQEDAIVMTNVNILVIDVQIIIMYVVVMAVEAVEPNPVKTVNLTLLHMVLNAVIQHGMSMVLIVLI